MSVVLVQGASRGIGLEFARVLSLRGNTQVIGTCRDPKSANELRGLNITEALECDVTSEESIQYLSNHVKQRYGKLDLLINNSGILHPSGKGETRLQDVSSAGLMSTFAVNAFGPLLVAKHLAPLLQKGTGLVGSQKFREDGKKCHSAVLVNMSARVGSISDNGLGGWHSYRMSKAALNMANKNLSIELGRGKNRVICLLLHPGTTDTDLSKPYHKNVPSGKLFSTEFTVSKLLGLVDESTIEDTGRYLAWDGQDIPF